LQPAENVEDVEATSEDAVVILEAARFYREQFGADADSIAITLGIRAPTPLLQVPSSGPADSWELGADLSRARLSLLRAIFFGEGHRLTLNELGRKMKVSRTNITNLIDGLERDGLGATRDQSCRPPPRRCSAHRQGNRGRECRLAAGRRPYGVFGTSFTAEERRQFAELLARYIDDLSRRSAADEAS
jgi:DNA-binding MarR family transcriptional regulator